VRGGHRRERFGKPHLRLILDIEIIPPYSADQKHGKAQENGEPGRFIMATLFVRHEVADFGVWKQAFDAFDAERKTMGVTGYGVYQAEGNPNSLTIYHHFESLETAKAFMGSERLREVMMAAGVQGEPDVWFATKA
jgi:quinol monooxygenase YgiN